MTQEHNNLKPAKQPKGCYIVGAILPIYLVIALALILTTHMDCFGFISISPMLRAHLFSSGFGGLGAAMATMRKYYRALITESTNKQLGTTKPPLDWSIGWVYYYISRPVLGGILGALVYTLSYVGIQILGKPENIQFSSEGRGFLFAIAFLAGYSVSHVLDRLEAISKQVFQGMLPGQNN